MPDITKGSSSDLSSKLEPKVDSLAKPSSDWLLQGRAEVQRNADLQDLFREKDKSVEWVADMVAARLAGLWNGNIGDASQVARYLVDEHRQLGEGVYLVSNETGLVLAKLSEEDIYQPPPVPRTNGNLAMPLPRVHPGTEALIVSHLFEKGREERLTAILAERAEQTALLREEGDRRLWIATRKGRAQLAQSLGENHPKRLLELAGGTAGAFLSHFDLALTPPEGVQGRVLHVSTSSTLRVNDPLTTNLNYDRLGSLRGILAQGWVRDLAKQISIERHLSIPLGGHPINIDDVTPAMIRRCELYVMDPEVMLAFLKKEPRGNMYLPANGAYTIGFSGKVGTLVIPDTFDLQSREISGRWEVSGDLNVEVYIPDWTVLNAIHVQGVAFQGEVVA